MVLIWISLMTNYVEHLFLCLLSICVSFLEKCVFKSFAHLLIRFLVHFLCFCIPSGLRTWLPQREASRRWWQETAPSAGSLCTLQLQQTQWHLWPWNGEVSGTLVCLGVCLTLRIRAGPERLHFQFEVIQASWFRESLNLAKCKIHIYFLQKGLAKWSDIVGGSSLINFTSLSLFMDINLGISQGSLVFTCSTGGCSQSTWEPSVIEFEGSPGGFKMG